MDAVELNGKSRRRQDPGSLNPSPSAVRAAKKPRTSTRTDIAVSLAALSVSDGLTTVAQAAGQGSHVEGMDIGRGTSRPIPALVVTSPSGQLSEPDFSKSTGPIAAERTAIPTTPRLHGKIEARGWQYSRGLSSAFLSTPEVVLVTTSDMQPGPSFPGPSLPELLLAQPSDTQLDLIPMDVPASPPSQSVNWPQPLDPTAADASGS